MRKRRRYMEVHNQSVERESRMRTIIYWIFFRWLVREHTSSVSSKTCPKVQRRSQTCQLKNWHRFLDLALIKLARFADRCCPFWVWVGNLNGAYQLSKSSWASCIWQMIRFELSFCYRRCSCLCQLTLFISFYSPS